MIALICAAFATYRIAVLLAEEEGPFEAATRLRNLHTADDWIGRGLRCPACLSFWLALPLAIAAIHIGQIHIVWWWELYLYWLAVAGAARWLWRMEP